MKKRGEFGLILVFILIGFILILSLTSMGFGKDSGVKVDSQVMQELQDKGKVKVIVVMKNVEELPDKLKGVSMQALREQAINNIAGERVKHRFTSFNGFSASLTSDDLKKLEADERIERIDYDAPVHAFLQESVPLVNATRTWPVQVNGINITGEGETICIIDTGVNYTHPDLGGCTIKNLSLSGNNKSYILENSPHPYSNENDTTWIINYTGFVNISVHFVNISTEDGWDFVIIYNGQNKTIATYSGTITNFWTPHSEGDTIYVRLVSDENIPGYGFYIDQVINGTTNTSYDWSNCTKIIDGWDVSNNDPNPYDNHGHGTHVTGIAAADGSIKGTAPKAKIVSIKALNSGGSGTAGEIIEGIEWCTENALFYNISSISLSLGCNATANGYSSYCDSNNDGCVTPQMVSAINQAVGKNISVIAATGNNGWTSGISGPACIQNVTAVGWSTDDTDIIHADSNRNNITDLFAPGSSINSTSRTGGYTLMEGTSMATPHVAGAFALVRQFYRQQTGKILTPVEIQDVLNNTGKLIDDSGGSGLNFSRIDVYSAILSLPGPVLTVYSPVYNGFYNSSSNILVNFSAIDAGSVSALWYYNGTANVTYTSENYTNISEEKSNTFIFYANDSSGNISKTNVVFYSSFDIPTINFTNPTIETGNYSQRAIWANVTANDTTLSAITVYLYNSTGLVNQTSSSASPFFINFTNLNGGAYYLNATANDSVGNINKTETRTINIEIDNPPSITINSPANGTWYNASRFNISINENGSCWAVFNDVTNITLNNITSARTSFFHENTSVNETTTLRYNVTFYCNDTSGNLNSTARRYFGVDKTAPIVSYVSPAHNYNTTDTTPTFTYRVNDSNDISSCSLLIDNVVKDTALNVLNNTDQTLTPESALSVADHEWQVSCIDEAGNTGITPSHRDITITSSDGEDGDGGDGGSTTTGADEEYTGVTYTLAESVIKNGTDKKLMEEDKVIFKINNRSHTLTIVDVKNKSIRIKIESDIIRADLNISDEKKFDLNKDNYLDFYVKLNGITGLVANITMKEIYELSNISINATQGNESITGTGGSEGGESRISKAFVWAKSKIIGMFSSWTWKTHLYVWITTGVVVIGWVTTAILIRRHYKKKKYYEKGLE